MANITDFEWGHFMQGQKDQSDGRQGYHRQGLVKARSLDDFAERLDSSKLLRGMLRRAWLVVLFAFLFALACSYISHRLASRFVASAYLLYEEDTAKNVAGVFPLTRISQASAVEMVRLPANLNAVRSILGLELSEKDLLGMISVSPPTTDSNLINIKVTADSPSLAVDIVNTIASVVVKSTKDYAKRQLNTANEYYKRQVELLQTQLGDKIKEITQFQKEHPFFEFGSSGSIAVKSFGDLEQRRQAALEAYNSQLIEYENLRREAERIPDQVVKYSEIDNPLRGRIAQAELNLIEAKTRFAPENPKLKAMESEIEQLKKLAKEQPSQNKDSPNPGVTAEYEKNPVKERLNLELLSMRGKLRSAQKLKEDIEAELARQGKELNTLPEEQVAYSRLVDSREQLDYELKRTQTVLKTLDALSSVGKSGVEIYQTADKAVPNDSILIQLLPLIGFILGSGFGLFVAFLVELSDRRLRTAKEVEAVYNLPCLITIPEFRFFSLTTGEIQLQYFIRSLEEKLEKSTAKLPQFSLAVLSSTKGEGKSSLVYFLARYYQELGKRCVVLEFDGLMRGIDVAGEAAHRPIEDFLRGEATVDDILVRGPIDRIQSARDHRLKELLKLDRMNQLLVHLKQHYEVILLDVPGLLEADYADNLAQCADVSIFVIGSKETPGRSVELSLHELEHLEVIPAGIVLNRVLRIYIDDMRIKGEAKRARVGLFTRIRSWMRKE